MFGLTNILLITLLRRERGFAKYFMLHVFYFKLNVIPKLFVEKINKLPQKHINTFYNIVLVKKTFFCGK